MTLKEYAVITGLTKERGPEYSEILQFGHMKKNGEWETNQMKINSKEKESVENFKEFFEQNDLNSQDSECLGNKILI